MTDHRPGAPGLPTADEFGQHMGPSWLQASLDDLMRAGVVVAYASNGDTFAVTTRAGAMTMTFGELTAFMTGAAATFIGTGLTANTTASPPNG
jgi:hypothetical protein